VSTIGGNGSRVIKSSGAVVKVEEIAWYGPIRQSYGYFSQLVAELIEFGEDRAAFFNAALSVYAYTSQGRYPDRPKDAHSSRPGRRCAVACNLQSLADLRVNTLVNQFTLLLHIANRSSVRPEGPSPRASRVAIYTMDHGEVNGGPGATHRIKSFEIRDRFDKLGLRLLEVLVSAGHVVSLANCILEIYSALFVRTLQVGVYLTLNSVQCFGLLCLHSEQLDERVFGAGDRRGRECAQNGGGNHYDRVLTSLQRSIARERVGREVLIHFLLPLELSGAIFGYLAGCTAHVALQVVVRAQGS
jgi:hypothetical protein